MRPWDGRGMEALATASAMVAGLAEACASEGVDLDAAIARGRAIHAARRATGTVESGIRAALDVAMRVLVTLGPTHEEALGLVLEAVDDPALAPLRAFDATLDQDCEAFHELVVIACGAGLAIEWDGWREVTPRLAPEPFDGTLGERLGALSGMGEQELREMLRERRGPREPR